ncbi:Putative Pc12g14900 protein [[Torrubiella] hemipterigena]|uniref:Putative Pc12g14900 protein n=1 Tax=[Torrubiella] hemipterigena TaxID=1531966 RepID=A0A0A1TN11_9HYPO|nr:Putative Pc12g14900 protein [[Torrubiella] hemipterigena]
MRPMPIIRSRTGCFTCRRRKKKCNEEKPICIGCKRNKLECHWPTEPNQVLHARPKPSTSSSAAAKVASGQTVAASSSSSSQPTLASVGPNAPPQLMLNINSPARSRSDSSPDAALNVSPRTIFTNPRPRALSNSSSHDAIDVGIPLHLHEAPDAGHLASSPIIELISPSLLDDKHAVMDEDDLASPSSSSGNLAMTLRSQLLQGADAGMWGIAPTISMLPSQGNESLELLSHYLSRTANSMGNGSTDVNPFVSQLVPIAFSNPLVLQLILAQSASHRQASGGEIQGNEVAQKYYTDSLRMFRNVVDEYMSGKEENTLDLTIGSLILSLTEVARGDKRGTIFDHLKASESMLTLLINRPQSEVPSDLADFLVEYYLHMTAASMISTDPRHKVPSLSPEVEAMARSLVEKGYIGQLAGCWLELLLIIPQIFHLGQRMMASEHNGKTIPNPDDIMTFGFLQSQIMAYFPDPAANPYSRLAGLVFKQATLLYLWSILGTPTKQDAAADAAEPKTGSHKSFITMAVAEAISILSQFPATLRINTSLCWPLAVIGCCTTDPDVQSILRERLRTMLTTIGLGNMRETLTLLEHVWAQPAEDMSPWLLARSMQEHRIWISFA